MKKQLLILFLIMFNIFFFFYSLSTNVLALSAKSSKWAQIQHDDVFFFNEKKEALFTLPKTFYCQILSPVDSSGYYYCKYINAYGYVKKSDVQCVADKIAAPYLDYANFRILASQSAELRSEPSREGGARTLLCSLDLYQTNFILYGKMQGEEVVQKRGTNWFYCEYANGSSSFFGYVYAGLCDQVKEYNELEINPNPIDEFIWESEQTPSINNSTDEKLAFVMPDSNQMLIIVCISVPILILLLTLFIPIRAGKSIKNKTIKNNPPQEKPNIINIPKHSKRLRRAEKGKDFYELK